MFYMMQVTLITGSVLNQVYLLKSIPLRLYANYLSFTNISFSTALDWTNVSRLILAYKKKSLDPKLSHFFDDVMCLFCIYCQAHNEPFDTCTH